MTRPNLRNRQEKKTSVLFYVDGKPFTRKMTIDPEFKKQHEIGYTMQIEDSVNVTNEFLAMIENPSLYLSSVQDMGVLAVLATEVANSDLKESGYLVGKIGDAMKRLMASSTDFFTAAPEDTSE